MKADLMRRRLGEARVGHLATVGEDGDPHVIPVCFVLDGDSIYWAVDHKPKATRVVRRLLNLASHPSAELVVDHFEEDWSRLWWVRVRVVASVLREDADGALDMLAAKYEQYRAARPDGPVVRMEIVRWRAWSAG